MSTITIKQCDCCQHVIEKGNYYKRFIGLDLCTRCHEVVTAGILYTVGEASRSNPDSRETFRRQIANSTETYEG